MIYDEAVHCLILVFGYALSVMAVRMHCFIIAAVIICNGIVQINIFLNELSVCVRLKMSEIELPVLVAKAVIVIEPVASFVFEQSKSAAACYLNVPLFIVYRLCSPVLICINAQLCRIRHGRIHLHKQKLRNVISCHIDYRSRSLDLMHAVDIGKTRILEIVSEYIVMEIIEYDQILFINVIKRSFFRLAFRFRLGL
ncbi:MAG: hypothetical protein IJL97_02285 [Lachnospiraceae bacterium]|nr:hypothetical protein [Lachnospiraceae bacterium]